VDKAKQTRDGRLNAYDSLDARKTALVVVDMQNYFVADGMPACAPEARTIVPNIIESLRNNAYVPAVLYYGGPYETSGTAGQLEKRRRHAITLLQGDLADEVIVLNVGGYIGSLTRSEIAEQQSTFRKTRRAQMARTSKGGGKSRANERRTSCQRLKRP